MLSSASTWIAAGFVAATLVLPTVVSLVHRRRHGPRRRPVQAAAWCCLWTGQLVVVAITAGIAAVEIARALPPPGSWPFALLFAVPGVAIAGLLAVQSVRTFGLGAALLRASPPPGLEERTRRVRRRAALSLLVLTVSFVAVWAQISPGRWLLIAYAALVIAPLLATSGAVVVATTAARRAQA